MDNLLVLKKVDWNYHVQKLELTLNKLKEIGLKCDIKTFFFGPNEMEYLGLWVTRNVIRPLI